MQEVLKHPKTSSTWFVDMRCNRNYYAIFLPLQILVYARWKMRWPSNSIIACFSGWAPNFRSQEFPQNRPSTMRLVFSEWGKLCQKINWRAKQTTGDEKTRSWLTTMTMSWLTTDWWGFLRYLILCEVPRRNGQLCEELTSFSLSQVMIMKNLNWSLGAKQRS